MIKNQANIYQFILRDMIGQGMTGLSPTVRIRKDSGSFAATTNTPTEVGNGLYEVALTATECNCDIMAIEVTLPDGQFPAILTNEYLTSSGGATPQQIWEYTGGRTVDNTIPSVNDIWGRQAGDTTSRTLTSSPTDITSLATSSELATAVSDIVSAMPDVSDLSTFDASQDTVTIASTQASSLINGVLNAAVANRDTGSLGSTVLAISGYTDEVESKIDSVSTKLADLPIVRALLDHWAVSGSTLTCYDSTGNVLESCTLTKDENGEIIAVTPND